MSTEEAFGGPQADARPAHSLDCALVTTISLVCTCGALWRARSGQSEPTITVKHHAAYIPVSTEQALDAGLITEEQARAQGWTPYVPPPVPWHRRARWLWLSWRERAGRHVGGWLAGVDLSERDEDW